MKVPEIDVTNICVSKHMRKTRQVLMVVDVKTNHILTTKKTKAGKGEGKQ